MRCRRLVSKVTEAASTQEQQADMLADTQKESNSNTASHSDPFSTYVGARSSQQEPENAPQEKGANVDSGPRGPEMPCFMMPLAKNKDFYGRQSYLAMLDRAFFDDSPGTPSSSIISEVDTPKTFAICGPGGMGKTQLAAEFVYTRKDRFDAIFWIHADRAAKVAEDFGKIAVQLGLVSDSSPDIRDPVVLRDLVKGWLANPVKTFEASEEETAPMASWLIVFDNVDEPDELEDYWPLDGSGCVLFTSRDPYTKDSRYLATRGADLLPFEIDEASKFLSKLTKKDGDSTSVVGRLGYLPLAITQMAGVIVRRGLSFNEFLQNYDEEESHLEMFEHAVHPKARRSDYTHTLASVWALGTLKHGAILLDTISFLDPDGVHERILTTYPHKVALKEYPRTSTVYFKAREELLHSSLVSKDNSRERLVVHRLIQDAARARMTRERYREVFTAALALVASVWPYEAFGYRHNVARWKVCEELFPHILKLKQLAKHVQPPLGSSIDDLEFAKIMTDAGW
jgi:hypothetical protein